MLQYQPDLMGFQLMSLLTMQDVQGITSQNVREKEEMRLSACYLICSLGSAQINYSPNTGISVVAECGQCLLVNLYQI